MTMKTRPVLPLLAVVVLLAAPACSRRPDATAAARKIASLPVLVAEARELRPADFADGPRLLGTIKGDVETALSFRTGGLVEWIGPEADGARGWREGARVQKGEPLARLVQTDVTSAVTSAEAALRREEAAWARTQRLREEKVVSASDVDKARAAWESAEADLRRARQALADSVLVAPHDGFVLARSMERGEMAAAGSSVVRFGDFRRMTVTLAVPDRWVSGFREGMEVPFTVSAWEGRPFVGRVTEVGVAARANDRLFKVELKVDNAPGDLRSGMTASVPVLGGLAPLPGEMGPAVRPLLVPLAALTTRSEPGRAEARLIVFVADGGATARGRIVETGDILGSSILVTGGELRAGDRVVVSAADEIHEGAPLDPRAAAPAAGAVPHGIVRR